MAQNSIPVGNFLPYISFLIKDVGSRLSIFAHYMKATHESYPVMRHQNVRVYRGMMPSTQDAAFIAPSAFVTGNVALGHDVCVYYHTVIRNYHSKEVTVIGDRTVVLDRVSFMGQVRVGSNSLIGIGATLDCCEVGDGVFIGPGASVALGAAVECNAIVAAGAAVGQDVRVHAGELWAGNPAQKVADVTPEQMEELQHMVQQHISNGKAHQEALNAHYEETRELDLAWFDRTMAQVEQRQKQVGVSFGTKIPREARQFLKPRVSVRRPKMQLHSSYPVNRIAPWMFKPGDATANA